MLFDRTHLLPRCLKPWTPSSTLEPQRRQQPPRKRPGQAPQQPLPPDPLPPACQPLAGCKQGPWAALHAGMSLAPAMTLRLEGHCWGKLAGLQWSRQVHCCCWGLESLAPGKHLQEAG